LYFFSTHKHKHEHPGDINGVGDCRFAWETIYVRWQVVSEVFGAKLRMGRGMRERRCDE